MAFSSNGSLGLLSAYNSSGDESDDETPAPRVSVKRTLDNKNSLNGPVKRHAVENLERLPSPSAIANMFVNGTEADLSLNAADDHGGRIRSFAHERGNWASYVYVTVDPGSSIQSLIDVVLTTSDSSLNLQRSENLHISLTRTVILKHHWIEQFSSSVQKISQTFDRFPVCLGAVKVYCNEECTRTFIGIEVTAGQERLLKVTRRLDEALSDFKLPTFYEEPSYHVSIAWCVGDARETISCQLPRLQSVLDMFIHSQPLQWSTLIDKLYFRTGNKHFVYNLQSL